MFLPLCSGKSLQFAAAKAVPASQFAAVAVLLWDIVRLATTPSVLGLFLAALYRARNGMGKEGGAQE